MSPPTRTCYTGPVLSKSPCDLAVPSEYTGRNMKTGPENGDRGGSRNTKRTIHTRHIRRNNSKPQTGKRHQLVPPSLRNGRPAMDENQERSTARAGGEVECLPTTIIMSKFVVFEGCHCSTVSRTAERRQGRLRDLGGSDRSKA